MGWLSNIFSLDTGNKRSPNGKSLVFSSTHDAFSLPTSSPIFPTHHPDAFNPDTLHTPDPITYTYPPQSPASYAYPSRPHTATSLLPTHIDALHTPSYAPYPPLSKTWARIHNWLNREYPELGDTLNYGILPAELAQLEMQFGFALPPVVRESFLCVDGQEAESAAGCAEGLFFGLTLLPLESVLEEWRYWREVDHDPMTGANPQLLDAMQSIPPGWIRKEYSQRGWIPLISDKVGNYVGVDLNPADQGQIGQVIVFGRDFDTKVVLWNGDGLTGWAKWLASFVEELESGEGFDLGNVESEGSDDELGYESYFYDGSGRGQGDGGGEIGSGGGLRLAGEYRGWNVLEAWADRSLRKWHEAGIITDADLVPMEELPMKQNPGDLDIVDVSQGLATDIPIPILNHSQERIPSPPPPQPSGESTLKPPPMSTSTRSSSNSSGAGSNASGSGSGHVPRVSISTTKAPAPLPVDLPTPHDISPASSILMDDDIDLEAARGPRGAHSVDSSFASALGSASASMREASEAIGLVSATRRIGNARAPVRQVSMGLGPGESALAPEGDELVTPRSGGGFATQQQAEAAVDDLLLMDSAPLEPLAKAEDAASSVPKSEISTAPAPESKPESEPAPEAEGPDTTIRLVGGGGQVGISSSPVEGSFDDLAGSPPASAPTDHSEVSSASESDAPAAASAESGKDAKDKENEKEGKESDKKEPKEKEKEKGHKKSKSSLASLKRFSVGVGLGKKKSVGSIKDGVSS